MPQHRVTYSRSFCAAAKHMLSSKRHFGDSKATNKSNTVQKNIVAKEATMSDLMLDVDQAGELKAAFRRGEWTNADIKKACEGDHLVRFRDVVRGYAQITQTQYIVDCDAAPLIPNGWEKEDHKKGGQLTLDMTKIRLHFSSKQQNGGYIEGNKLRKELASEPILNANVLDYLLAHPELIPEEWKGKCVFFWGTIYRGSGGVLAVRCLDFGGGAWDWDYYWLGFDFLGRSPAVVLAS